MADVWTVYAISVAGAYEYIGIAKYPSVRRHQHKGDQFFGIAFEMVTLAEARTKASARKKEAALIRKHKPPKNVQHNGPRTYQVVKAKYGAGSEDVRDFRLYPGVMHPDQAREVWHGSNLPKSSEVIKLMPGWTKAKASYWFGYRQGLIRIATEALPKGVTAEYCYRNKEWGGARTRKSKT